MYSSPLFASSPNTAPLWTSATPGVRGDKFSSIRGKRDVGDDWLSRAREYEVLTFNCYGNTETPEYRHSRVRDLDFLRNLLFCAQDESLRLPYF